MGVACSQAANASQPWLPMLGNELRPCGRVFCPRTTRAAVLGTNNTETSLRSIVRVVFLKKHPSLCPAWRFWSRGEPSGRRRVPKRTRVGAPATTFCLGVRRSLQHEIEPKHVRGSAKIFAALQGSTALPTVQKQKARCAYPARKSRFAQCPSRGLLGLARRGGAPNARAMG